MAFAAAGAAALQKFIADSEISVKAKVDINELWTAIVDAEDHALKDNGWIVNCSKETVRFYVYNSNDWVNNSPFDFLAIPSHKVDAQPGETVQVHGGVLLRPDEEMVVYKNNRGTAYNVKRNHLHFWTGSAMIPQQSTMERFKNQYYDPRKQLKGGD